ncbi:hypothetical protein [Flavobacterium sp. CS20]|jgi:hypothetical protein|uniref:hypothetical protein n=1 Tax=Flavobacterium sp. CS20 TaxID=2775246 RepID=UPI001B3A449C|nr:hypothetical protein [Flavobacterium sp. CS20]QTY27778.1 hypothetical protein IGB25_04450 [Flavobacterium sp. CS20]
MIKVYLFAFIFTFSLFSFGQCEYSEMAYDNTTNKAYLKSLPITLDIYETPLNGRIVLASLIRTGNQYFIEIEITKDSSAQDLEPICFEKGSRLNFSLKNGSIVSISQVDEKICGIKLYDEETEYTTVSNYAKFILTQKAFDELIKSEIVLIKISATNYEKTFVLKDELIQNIENSTIVTYPSRFFIDNIECMTNPKF